MYVNNVYAATKPKIAQMEEITATTGDQNVTANTSQNREFIPK